MTTAQQIADIAQKDFPAAIALAHSEGYDRAVWFAGKQRVFADGSVLTLRAGKVQSPLPSATYTYVHHDA